MVLKCAALNRSVGIEKRREQLVEILDSFPDKPIFDKMLAFYKGILLQSPDLVVFMSRKSWCVVHLFLPFLASDPDLVVDEKKLTHDRMVHPWLAGLDPEKRAQLKVFVIDDTFQIGRALDDCVRRLIYAYGIDKNNLTVAVFAMVESKRNLRRIDGENKLYTVSYSSLRKIPSFQVKWGGGNFYSKYPVSAFSNFFVQALHACSEPYVGYIPAFCLPIDVVQKFLGANRGQDVILPGMPDTPVSGYLEQEDLRRPPLNDSSVVGYYNITTQQMRQHDVEAFYFSLPYDVEKFYASLPAVDSDDKNDLSFFPPKHALSVEALRFYINRNTGIALMVPYLSLKDCYADRNIVEMFPKELQPLLSKMPTENWKDREDYLAAYRLLRYAAGYLWGKHVFKRWFGLDVKDENIASEGGICSEQFFNWLNGSSASEDLKRIWPFFASENVVEETQGQKLEKIIQHDMPDYEVFKEAIKESLSVKYPVDYYSTVSMMFRNILNQERQLLHDSEIDNKEVSSLPPPFNGFPVRTFYNLLLLRFPQLNKRKNVPVSVMLMLCDTGVAVTQLTQYKGIKRDIIGTVLLNGEQSCHTLAPVAPAYARFISELPEVLRQYEKKKRQKICNRLETEIKKYFKKEIKQGMGRRLTLKELMSPFKYIKTIVLDDQDREFDAYSSLPGSSFFDCSEQFFMELREKHIA